MRGYRNAGLLAKEAACVDVFSGGRLILGIGAGWYEREYQAYGFPFPSAGTRLAILEETVEVIKRLWTEETVTFQGKHLAFDGAYCDPKPLQQLPRDLGRRRRREGDAAHRGRATPTRPTGRPGSRGSCASRACSSEYCDEIGRDFDSIVRTHGPDCRLFDTEADLKPWLDSPGGGSLWGRGDRTTSTSATTSSAPPSRWPRRCRSSSTRAVASSCSGSATSRRRESLEAFAREVVPHVTGLTIGRRALRCRTP